MAPPRAPRSRADARPPPRLARLAASAAIAATSALALLAGSGCERGAPDAVPRPPDVVLVVIDTLRADHLGSHGYARDTSPTLDALAREGLHFRNATSTSSWTRPAMASLFTGRLPSEVGMHTTTDAVAPRWPMLAERLRARGYRAVGVTGNFVHVGESSGLHRGFDPFVPIGIRASEGSDMVFELDHGDGSPPVPLRAPTAAELNERLFASLDAVDDLRNRPLFLYVHYMDPHSGYLPPPDVAGRFSGGATGPPATSDYVIGIASGRTEAPPAERERLVALYDEEIRAVDAGVAALLDGLARRDLAQEALWIVLSDHGEAFGEHGGWFHGLTLHRELLHVPLIVHDRRPDAPRGVRDEPVDLLDVEATIRAAAGVDDEDAPHGRDLLAGPLPERPRVAELEHDSLREERVRAIRHRRAVGLWPWKAIVDVEGDARVHHLGHDPHEQEPVALDDPAVPETLRELTHSAWHEAAAVGREAPPELAPETREGLRALGYAE